MCPLSPHYPPGIPVYYIVSCEVEFIFIDFSTNPEKICVYSPAKISQPVDRVNLVTMCPLGPHYPPGIPVYYIVSCEVEFIFIDFSTNPKKICVYSPAKILQPVDPVNLATTDTLICLHCACSKL